MARDIYDRLTRLNQRRKGFDRLHEFSLDSADAVVAKSILSESYSNRSGTKSFTKYALGAMQEVDPDYTRISIEEAERVQRQVAWGLSNAGISHEFRLQGSVPANLHIRGISDVDLLVLDGRFYSYDSAGIKARSGYYAYPWYGSPIEALGEVRTNAEDTLTARFPKADVDKSRSKSVKISGGSLRRPVDVVPANWYDTAQYQQSGLQHDRGVQILDKAKATRIYNQPFRHIHLIDMRDGIAGGGLKKAIRLCKNVKEDSASEVALSSFDIASTMYRADMETLRGGVANELGILAQTQRHLDLLATNHAYAKTLDVPDGSRKIFDEDGKLQALNRLSIEIDDLMLAVSQEVSRYPALGRPTVDRARQYLIEAHVP